MDVLNDRVINVPISDEDVVRNVTSLPRTKETNGLINLKMKRRMMYKSYYQMQAARPEMIYKALYYFKENNPFYKDVKLLPYEEFIKDCQDETDQDNEITTEEDNLSSSEGLMC